MEGDTTPNERPPNMCCKRNCLSILGKEESARVSLSICAMSLREQRSWLLTTFSTSYCEENHKFSHTLCGKAVCTNAFLTVTTLKKSRYYEVRQSFLRGQLLMPPSLDSTRFHIGPELAVQWLRLYANENGDKLPNREKILLPCSLTKAAVYEQYAQEYSSSPFKVSLSTFMKHWSDSCPHITIPKRSRFSKCTLCDLFAKMIPVEKNKEMRGKMIASRQAHLQRVRNEREKYYHHCAKAKHDTKSYLTLIIDGMDQQKTMLPHYVSQSKAMSNKQQLKVQVTGALSHGHGSYVFLQYGQYPSDSNLTITVLIKCLQEISPLPKVLYLQMDNCCGQNKNKYVLAFLAHLVQKGVFRKIKLSFLPVGHTHEDVDQMFSRFSSYLDKNDAVTTSALQRCLQSSYTPSPKVIDLFEVWDAKQGFSKYIDDIRYHTQPHHFRFLLVNGRVEMKYKHWCEDEVWQPSDENENVNDEEDDGDDESGDNNQLYILKESYAPLSALPLVSPKLDSLNLEQLMTDLYKLPPDYLSDEKKREWEEFHQKLCRSTAVASTNKCLPEFSSVDERGEPPTFSNSSPSAGAPLPHSISTLIEKENKRTPICIGKRARAYTLHPSLSLTSHDDLKSGDYVAVMPDEEQYAGQPWIAQCITGPSNEKITVQWLKGALSRPWTPDRRYNQTEIDVKTIINTVQFTPTQKLTKRSIETIKQATSHLI